MIGDALHNLKCALDIAWIDTVKRLSPTGYNPETKFPVRKNRQDLESVLEKTGKVLPDSPLFRFMVEGVKSYEGGSPIFGLFIGSTFTINTICSSQF
jgi:hypothetical protein